MIVSVTFEFDYVNDKDALDFVSTQEELTKCIKNMTMKKEKKDNPDIANNFGTVMSKAFANKASAQAKDSENNNDNNNINEESDYIE